MQCIEPLKIQIAAIHDVDRTHFRDEFIKNVNFMNCGIGYRDKRWDISPQIQ